MPVPSLLDHVLVALLIAVVPLWGVRGYRRLVRRARAGDPNARLREYRRTTLLQWAVAVGIVAVWWVAGRPLEVLGFAIPGGARLWAGAGVTLAGLAFLQAQWSAVRRMDEKGREALRGQMASVADFLPRTDREAARFRVLAVTAGVCEEVVYRGYLIWYLAAFVGPWAGAVAAAALFGVLHIYQGAGGAVRTGLVGLVAAFLFVGTGSLLWPVILHAAIDLQGGAVARRVLGSKTPPAEPVPAGPPG